MLLRIVDPVISLSIRYIKVFISPVFCRFRITAGQLEMLG